MYNPDKIFIRKAYNQKSEKWEYASKVRKIKRVYNQKLIKCGDEHILTKYSKPMYSYTEPKKNTGDKKAIGQKRQDNLIRTKVNLYRIAKANEKYFKHKPVFLTLTFDPKLFPDDYLNKKENVHVHFKTMIKKLRQYGNKCEYILIYEQHKTGNYHMHILLYNTSYISIQEWRSVYWPHGYIDIKLLDKIDNISAYFVKYMQKDFIDNNELNKKLYTTSRGLNKVQTIYNNQEIAYYVKRAKDILLVQEKSTPYYLTKTYRFYA